MFLESFHRVLKMLYLNNKQNKRIDMLLTTLLKMSRDKAFERLRKLEIGKRSHRICELNKRHKKAQQLLSSNLIINAEEHTWTVASSETAGKTYTIEKNEDTNCKCMIRCTECNICPHTYLCNCIDAVLNVTICKHVHLVHMQFGQIDSVMQSPSNDDTTHQYFSKILSDPEFQDTILSVVRSAFISKLHELEALVMKCNNFEVIKSANKHINAVVSLMTTDEQQQILPVKRKISPNENVEHQPKFFSTKKKRKISNTKSLLSRPSEKEVIKVKQILSKEPKYCGSCLKEDDSDYNNDDISWIQCQKCSLWLHLFCTNPKLTVIPEIYTCHFCSK